ncbi:tetratricopeptide repeat protein [Desulfovibrio inopinatus]|uniref:tetratricopeptide repeat protein n=1 Tax=Desulfovibrio inopinatus TaxID=102109 RepID=UPI00048421FD|nr:tetratricopeptide repeat protein [Desulfovibrio inopinatus]
MMCQKRFAFFLPIVLSIFLATVNSFAQTPIPGTPVPEPAPGQDEITTQQARLELARLLSYSKRYDEAIAEYKMLLKDTPDDFTVQAELARVYYWKGDETRALTMLRALPQTALDTESALVLADIYAATKQYEQATALYKRHLQSTPNDDTTRLKLADTLSWMKQYPESLAQYKQILAKHPHDIQVRRRYARVLSWAGRTDDAIKELQMTLKPTP